MGQPNWKRLAELGQLPDYMKDQLPANFREANEEALKSRREEPNKEPEIENKNIQDIIDENEEVTEVPLDEVKAELLKKTNSELRDILKENGLDDSYAKNADLIERIVASPKEEEKKEEEEEKIGEFVDELLS